MSEFMKITGKGGDYSFAHYTQIRVTKQNDECIAWIAENIYITLDKNQAEELMEKLDKFPLKKKGYFK